MIRVFRESLLEQTRVHITQPAVSSLSIYSRVRILSAHFSNESSDDRSSMMMGYDAGADLRNRIDLTTLSQGGTIMEKW